MDCTSTLWLLIGCFTTGLIWLIILLIRQGSQGCNRTSAVANSDDGGAMVDASFFAASVGDSDGGCDSGGSDGGGDGGGGCD